MSAPHSKTQTLPTSKAPSSVAVGPHSEWANHHGVLELFGIRRTFAYHLAKEGLIESKAVKHGAQRRGVRLFNVPSIRQYIDSCKPWQWLPMNAKPLTRALIHLVTKAPSRAIYGTARAIVVAASLVISSLFGALL